MKELFVKHIIYDPWTHVLPYTILYDPIQSYGPGFYPSFTRAWHTEEIRIPSVEDILSYLSKTFIAYLSLKVWHLNWTPLFKLGHTCMSNAFDSKYWSKSITFFVCVLYVSGSVIGVPTFRLCHINIPKRKSVQTN